jgi:hypothetical protein
MNDWPSLSNLISQSEVVTLLCSDQWLKVNFISKILSLKYPSKKLVIYLDIDTFFTVFLEDMEKSNYVNSLLIFRVKPDNLSNIINDVCSLNQSNIGTIILDSVSSYYHLFSTDIKASEVNRKLGLHLALLKMITSRGQGQIILTSLRRAKKKKGEKAWHISYAGGKLLQIRSELILELTKRGELIEVSILKSLRREEEKKLLLDFNVENI